MSMQQGNTVGRGRTVKLLATAMLFVSLSACERFADPDALVLKAQQAIQQKDSAGAVIHLKNALQSNADHAGARLELGKLYLQSHDPASAEKELRRARDLRIPDDTVVPLLALAMYEQGNGKQMLDEFGAVRLNAPAAMSTLSSVIGDAQLVANLRPAARTTFDAALALDPKNERARLGLARLQAMEGDVKGASAVVEEMAAETDSNADLELFRGALQLGQNEADKALESFRRSYKIDPSQVDAYSRAIELNVAKNRHDEARKDIAALRSAFPRGMLPNYYQGLVFYREANYTKAREALSKVLAVSADHVPSLEVSGLTHLALGDHAQAEQQLEKVLSLSPGNAIARHAVVLAYLKEGRVAKAKAAFEPLMKTGSQNPQTIRLAGEIALVDGRAVDAVRLFEKAVETGGESALLHSRLAEAYVATGQPDKAAASLERSAAMPENRGEADLALAAFHLRHRSPDKALAAISAYEKKQPGQAVGPNLRGSALLVKRQPDEARKAFEQALAIDPTFFAAASNLARLDAIAGKQADAVARFRAVLAKAPDQADALLSLAALLEAKKGDDPEVLKVLRHAVAANPAMPVPRAALTHYYVSRNNPKEALKVANEAMIALPDDPVVLDSLGIAQISAGEADLAVSTFQKAVMRQPDLPQPLVRLAVAQIKANRAQPAEQALRKALQLNPDNIEAQRILMNLYIDQSRFDEAVKVAQSVQKRRPDGALGFLMESEVHASAGKAAATADALRQAHRRERSPTTASRLYVALTQSGKPDEAEKLASEWLQAHPKDLGMMAVVAENALATKQLERARGLYEKVLAESPESVVVLNNLAWLSGELKDPKALGYAERAYRLAPKSAAVLDTYGMLLASSGDDRKAIDLMRQAVEVSPRSNGIRLNLAKVLLKSGDKTAARKELEQVASAGDKSPAGREASAMLRTL